MMKSGSILFLLLFCFTAFLFCNDTASGPETDQYRYDSSGRVRSWGNVRLGPEGFTDVQDGRWIMQRFDPKGRPRQRIVWVDSALSEQSEWKWNSDGYIVTTLFADGVKEVVSYTNGGQELSSYKTDAVGKLMLERFIDYNGRGDAVEIRERTPTQTRLQKNEYSDDNLLKYTLIETNGMPALERHYTGEQNWQETVYHRGRPVLRVQYRDSVRISEREIR